MHRPFNWNPLVANPIDYIKSRRTGKPLVTPDGRQVEITQSGTDLVVTIGTSLTVTTGGNLNTCYYLNVNEVGIDL